MLVNCYKVRIKFQRMTEHIDFPDFLIIIKINRMAPQKISINKRSSLELQLKTGCFKSVLDLWRNKSRVGVDRIIRSWNM